MRSIFLVALFLVVIAMTTVAGDEVLFYRSAETPEPARLVSGGPDEVVVELAVPALLGRDVVVEGYGLSSQLRVPGGGLLAATGAPGLPVVRHLVMVPARGRIDLEVIEEETIGLGSMAVAPFQPFVLRSGQSFPFEMDEEIYGTNEWFPGAAASLEGVSILRDLRVAHVRFQPVRYNPITGEVLLTTRATVRLTVDSGSPGRNELERSGTGITRGFLPFYEGVIGFETPPEADLVDGCFVFISTEEGLEAVEDLIQWKRQRGFDVELGVVPNIGSTAEEIDGWIEFAFNVWANPPEWIIIVGGEDVVPPPYYSGFEADNIYGVIGEDTSVPSIHVGRLTGGDMSNMTYQAWKVHQYQMNPWQPTESWFQNAIVVGSGDVLDPLHSWEHCQIFMAAGMTVDYYCASSQYGGAPPDLEEIVADVNEGRSLFSYIGHGGVTGWGTSGFSVSDVENLTNGRKWPWINSIACSTGDFGGNYCFAEAWMAEGDQMIPKGAIAIMAATTGSPFGPTDSLAEYTFRGYFEENIWHMGAAVDYGKMKVEEFYGPGGWSSNMMHMIFGCPELDIYHDTSPIDELSASHSEMIWTGSWPVYVTAEEGRYAVEGAMVGLVQADELLDAAYTDASGYAELQIAGLPYGQAEDGTITVTYHNCAPYIATVEPAPEGVSGPGPEAGLWLSPAMPNPFSGSTSIGFALPAASGFTLEVFDMSGRLVRTLASGQAEAGAQLVEWDGTLDGGGRASSGVYLYRLTTGAGSLVHRCVLMR